MIRPAERPERQSILGIDLFKEYGFSFTDIIEKRSKNAIISSRALKSAFGAGGLHYQQVSGLARIFIDPDKTRL